MSESLLKYFDWQSPRRSLLEEYAQFDASAWEHMLRTRGENFWQKAGERRALELFRAAAAKVPAYKDFLRKEKVRPGLIKTARDFAKVPPTDKKNYTDRYDLAARSWGGNLSQAKLIAVSSGTTGAPKFWPRSHYQEFEAAVIHELLYRYLLGAEKQRTLVMIGFPMGVYVSGVATLLPSWLAASKMGVALMSIGNNRMEMIRAVENLHKNFERVILVGHPFFIKDVITTGRERGVPWEKIQPRMMFCSEGFNEVWREHLAECAGLKGPRQRENMISTYGTSEMLLVAHETPLSLAARSRFAIDPGLAQKIFNLPFAPNLFQYNPFLRYIETQGEELLFTVASGLPLVRYNLHDSGEILPFQQIADLVKKEKGRSRVWQLPFLALRGRSDHTLILYAANIYPEHIHGALQHEQFLPHLTGKFALAKGYRRNMDEFWEVNLELREGVRPSENLSAVAGEHIINALKLVNMEYLDVSRSLGKDVRPRIKLWPYADPKFFRPGLKPKYIIES